MRHLLRGILLVAGLGGGPATGQAQHPEPLPKEVVEAWQRPGALPGWMGASQYENQVFWAQHEGWNVLPEWLSGPVPAFRIYDWPHWAGSTLPPPPRAFGLMLEGTSVTAKGLKGLGRMKNLQRLLLYKSEVASGGLEELAGLTDLQGLYFRLTKVSDAGLRGLAGLTGLRSLDLSRTGVTDAGLKELAGLTGLRSLYLDGTKVTDAGLKELAGLKDLRSLGLANTQVTDAGLKELAGFKNLTTLHFWPVTDASLRALREIDLLHTIDLAKGEGGARPQSAEEVVELDLRNTRVTDAGLILRGTKVTDAGLKELAGLKGLRSLYLGGTKVTDAGLKELAGLTDLQFLRLADTQVTDAGLKELAPLKQLQTLHLTRTQVTDAGLKELAGLKGLQHLYLDGTGVTDAGLKELAGLTGLQKLSLGGTKVTDAGLKELAGLKNLQNLELHGTKATIASASELQKSLPALSIGLKGYPPPPAPFFPRSGASGRPSSEDPFGLGGVAGLVVIGLGWVLIIGAICWWCVCNLTRKRQNSGPHPEPKGRKFPWEKMGDG